MSIRSLVFDARVTILFGLLGYLLKKYGYPPIATAFGVILAPIMDSELIRSYMMTSGRLSMIFKRPIVILFFAITIISVFSAIKKAKKTEQKTENKTELVNGASV
jgi:putative tricarboxylic transport membrane protein